MARWPWTPAVVKSQELEDGGYIALVWATPPLSVFGTAMGSTKDADTQTLIEHLGKCSPNLLFIYFFAFGSF